MEVIDRIPTWFWVVAFTVGPFIGAVVWWLVLQIQDIRLKHVTNERHDKDIDILHRANQSLTKNLRGEIRHANDRIDKKQDRV
jgi:hypothetical protein